MLKNCLKFYENYQKEIKNQRDLINDLSTRVENLEIHFNKNDQDIKKFKQDFYYLFKSDNEIILNNNPKFIKSLKVESQESQENISSKLDQIHLKIQNIIIRRENLGKIIKKRNFRILSYNFTRDELIQYTKSENFITLNNDIKRIINNLINKMLQDELTNLKDKNSIWEDNEDASSNLGDNTKNVDDVNSNRGNNTKDEKNQANNHDNKDNVHDNIQDNIHDDIHDDINDNINIHDNNYQETIPILETLHSQIQQIIVQKEILGYKVRLRHFKALLEKYFKIGDFIQYSKTNQFYSLNDNSQRLINLFILKNLTQEFEQENMILSQNLEEYIKRGLIPELPLKYNNYTEYRKSHMFHGLKKNLKRNVEKLVELEERLANDKEDL
ncbi:hypothetical protein C1646_792238 [Rhizophagus diaphanus]|nr:hypothetical protein C1646_792238 [Rhizophagus diaphanus] [Rhizophagus sp. MUCL 43196]